MVCASLSLTALSRSSIVVNAFSIDLEIPKSENFHKVAPRGVAKLSTSPEVTIFPPPVPYPFISDPCLKGERWTTLFLRNSAVAMIYKIFKSIKGERRIHKISRGETYVSINLLASTHLLIYIISNTLNFCKQKVLQIL